MSSPCGPASYQAIPHLNDDGFDRDSPKVSSPMQRYSPEQFPIFYLRIAIPSNTVVEVFGPFATPAGVIGKFRRYIQGHCPSLHPQLDAQFSSKGGSDAFLHFGMMVTDLHGRVFDVQVIREDNRDVKDVIRMQPVWTVVCTEMQHRAVGDPTIRDRQVLRSFPPTEPGEREAKALARSTAEVKLTDGNATIARIIWDRTGVLGVNNIYHVVGTNMGWSIEANLHEGPDIEFETASDENGRVLWGAVLNPVVLAQQHMEQQE